MRFFSVFVVRSILVLFVLAAILEVGAVTSGHTQVNDVFDGELHLWTAIGAGTVSIDVVVLTVALMFSFTRVDLALKFSGWMAFWHAAFTFLSTGLAVGLLLASRKIFGSEDALAAVVLQRAVNALVFLGAAFCIWHFFHAVVRSNAKNADLEVGANVLERPWRTKAFQLTILAACYDALYLAKPAMYENYSPAVAVLSIALIGLQVGVIALVGGLICFLINRSQSAAHIDSSGRAQFMLKGVKAEYFCFPFFLFWNLGKAAEQVLEPLTGLGVAVSVVAVASCYYSWHYWSLDLEEVGLATEAKACADLVAS